MSTLIVIEGQLVAASLPIGIQATGEWGEKLFPLFQSEKFVSARKVLFDCSHGELSNNWQRSGLSKPHSQKKYMQIDP